MTKTRMLEVGGEGQPRLKKVLQLIRPMLNTLELDILPHETSIGIEGCVSAVYEFPVTLPW